MQPFVLQIIMFLAAIAAMNHMKYGLRYQVIFFIPFTAAALFRITAVGGTTVTALHISGALLFALLLLKQKSLSYQATVKSSVIILPFILTLIYCSFYFEPVRVWDIQKATFLVATSLTLTNVTQLIYFVFALVLFVLFSSLEFDAVKLQKILNASLWTVVGVSVFQLVTYYAGVHDVYKFFFYNIGTEMVNQGFLWGWKRINATFQEPSYLAHFLFYTLLFYLLNFGYKEFIRSKAVIAAAIIGILSTATTFYLGFFIIILVLYFRYASSDEKMYYYVVLALIGPLVLYLLYDVIFEYYNSKGTSNQQRIYVSWTLAWEAFEKSPFFGVAYGTTRPLFIYTQLLTAIGIFGCTLFLVGLFWGGNTANSKIFLLGCLGVGLGNFELARPEMWLYFGMLNNRYQYNRSKALDRSHRVKQSHTTTVM